MLQNGAPAIDDEHVREALRAVLLEPEFEEANPNRRLLDFLKGLGRFFDSDPLGSLGPAMRWVVIAALVVVLLLLLAHIAWTLTQGFLALRGGTTRAAVRSGGKSRKETIADFLSEAENARSRGDWLGAMRAYFTASVAQLSRLGLLDLRPGFTHAEILDRGGASADDRRELAPLVSRLDVVWFGGEAATESDARHFRDAYFHWAKSERGGRRP